MTILTKETDLLKFINEKKNNSINLSHKVLYGHFNKIVVSSLNNCYNKILESNLSIKCLDTIYILFWFLIEYSKNIKLSSFLCDRAILLFTEYVLMVSSPMISNKGMTDVDITEVKSFVYKKTIGPIALNAIKKNIYQPHFYKFTYIIKEIYGLLFIKVENYNQDNVDSSLVITTFNKCHRSLNNYINDEIFIKDNLDKVNTKLLETFLNESGMIDDIDYIKFTNLVIIIIIASKLYKLEKLSYLTDILFLVNKKYHKEIINFTIIDKINVYTELDKLFSKLL